ncbi:START domain-containing protein [Durusdinium trenchii]|uniref:START domain-containing protein n=1 Tax=Durusdinium trenchii TaxID=1381693 RepID=A0ABP0MAM8_9DINO
MFRAWRGCGGCGPLLLRAGQVHRARYIRCIVSKREGKRFPCTLAFATSSFLACNIGSWSSCEGPEESKELVFADEEVALLASVVEAATENLLQWAQAPAHWWDECRTIRVAGFRDARHCQKKLEGFPLKLQMVSAVWEDVSLEELIMVTEVIDDCAKLQFVPVMEKVQTRLVFGGGLRLLQTSIRPALLGLVSSREVDSLMKEPEMRESGWVVSTGVGLQSPLLVEKIENGGSSVLKTLVSAPPSKGKVRAIDHTSGYAFRAGDQPRSWHVHILLLSEPGGGLPHWAMEMGIYYGILEPWTSRKEPNTVADDAVRGTWSHTRQGKAAGTVEAVRDLLKELQMLLEFFAAAAILGGLFADKQPSRRTLGTLPVNVPVKALDLTQPKDADADAEAAGKEEHDPPRVLQTLVAVNLSSFVKMVYHLEPAADIPEDEAQMIVDIQHADFVQRNLGAAPLQAELNDEAELEPRNELVPEDIFKGRVNRMSKDTSRHFLEGAALRPCRDALSRAGYEVEIQGGCLVFVHPHQYEDVLRALQTFTLTRADIVFAASFEYLVEQTLSLAVDVGCQGSWMKSRDQLPMEIETDGEQKEESVEVDGVLEIDRTFYRWRPATAAASNPKPLTF